MKSLNEPRDRPRAGGSAGRRPSAASLVSPPEARFRERAVPPGQDPPLPGERGGGRGAPERGGAPRSGGRQHPLPARPGVSEAGAHGVAHRNSSRSSASSRTSVAGACLERAIAPSWVSCFLAVPAVAQTAKPAPPAPDRATLLKRAATAVSAGRRPRLPRYCARPRTASSRCGPCSSWPTSNRERRHPRRDRIAPQGPGAGPERRGGSFPPWPGSPWPTMPLSPPSERSSPWPGCIPAVAEYHRRLGEALAATGAYAAAESSLRRAESLEPNGASTLIALGVALQPPRSLRRRQALSGPRPRAGSRERRGGRRACRSRGPSR